MRLLIENQAIKISDFIEYLIRNFNEKGKTYEAELIVDDRYDRKNIEVRKNSLKNKLLVLHNDGFEIIDGNLASDFVNFSETIKPLTGSNVVLSQVTPENFNEQLVHYKIWFTEGIEKHMFEFRFIDLSE
jgi:hypothetical protein